MTPRLPSHQARVREAKRIANNAISAATLIATDDTVNRSTRTRAAYKVKAQALDQVVRVLEGKS
jgi:hypothetical protein